MRKDLLWRRAAREDLESIINLLYDDPLGKNRENPQNIQAYEKAFKEISMDQNQWLMVLEKKGKVIGTCHLTVMPSLTFQGSRRLHLEAVRIDASYRGQGLGKLMIQKAMRMAQQEKCCLVELTTSKNRSDAKAFYEGLGFEATHEGMKWSVKDFSATGI